MCIRDRVRTLSKQWREVKNVDPNQGKKQWKNFSETRQAVYDKFEAVYDANIKLKETLIRQTESLLESEPNDDSLEKLKLYQARWKQVGITRRKQDQDAWAKFRKASDALFDRVKAARDENRKQQDSEIAAYTEITQKINSLAKTADNIAVADPAYEQLCNSFNNLPGLPKNLPERLLERVENNFQRAQANYSKARDRMAEQSLENIFLQLREKADLCSELEHAYFTDKADRANEIENKIESIEIGDSSIEKQLQARLVNAKNTDRTNANEKRRAMCIDLEVLLNIDSPIEDKALRMKRQLQRMSDKGLGASSINHEQTLKQFKLKWLCETGAEPDIQKALDQRFWALMDKA